MKVLQLGKFYPVRGGVEKVMWDLTKGLSESGIDCDMLCASLPEDGVDIKDRDMLDHDEWETGGFDLGERTIILNFNEHGRVICLPAKRKVAATMICPQMIKWLKKHSSEYDIIHVHHPDPMACMALWRSGFKGKVVLHWHSDILKQKGLLQLYKPLQNWLIHRADVILGTTPVYVHDSPYLQSVQDKVGFLPIGIEPPKTDEARMARIRAQYPGKKIVYTLGRLVEYKGFRYLVEAASYLPDDYQVVVGGRGPLMSELEEQARELGVSGKVTFLGWVDDDDHDNWFGACDVFCLSSIMKTEAFAIVQIEAMACGKPVVATKIPHSGVSWVNADGVSGLNVETCDAKALAEAIVKLTENQSVYAKFSEGAAARFESCFTLERMIEGCRKVYEGLAA